MRRGCDALELSSMLNRALLSGELKPSDVLVRNSVGNLAIERDGAYVGYVDLLFAEIDWFENYVMATDVCRICGGERPESPGLCVDCHVEQLRERE